MKVDAPHYQGSAEVLIQAPPQKVYELVSNLERMGEWSPECYRCEWLGEAEGLTVGARFKGWNRHGRMKWATTCRIITAEPSQELAWEVVESSDRVATRWRYRFEASDGGSKLVESFEAFYLPLWLRLIQLLFMGGRHGRTASLQNGMRRTLERIKAVVETQV